MTVALKVQLKVDKMASLQVAGMVRKKVEWTE